MRWRWRSEVPPRGPPDVGDDDCPGTRRLPYIRGLSPHRGLLAAPPLTLGAMENVRALMGGGCVGCSGSIQPNK